MERLTYVEALPGFRLRVRFEDGTDATLELKDELFGPMFEPLRDPAYFARVALDQFGAPVWPNGADLAPDMLYRLAHNAA